MILTTMKIEESEGRTKYLIRNLVKCQNSHRYCDRDENQKITGEIREDGK